MVSIESTKGWTVQLASKGEGIRYEEIDHNRPNYRFVGGEITVMDESRWHLFSNGYLAINASRYTRDGKLMRLSIIPQELFGDSQTLIIEESDILEAKRWEIDKQTQEKRLAESFFYNISVVDRGKLLEEIKIRYLQQVVDNGAREGNQ